MIKEMREKGMSITDISKKMGISRPTVRKYLREGKYSGYSREGRVSIVSQYEDYIRDMINRYNLSAVRIYENIRDKGYRGSYTTVKRICRKYRNDRTSKAVYRFETKPGEQSQVDFGEFGYIEMDGKRRKLYVFSMILGYSRMRYAEFTTDITVNNLIRLHKNAFTYFGGYSDSILYDNMKQVVIERKLNASESRFNTTFKDFMDYYGINIRLCHPYRPQTKGKIENTVKYIRNNFFNGREFHSLEEINSQCFLWLNNVNSRIHSTTGNIPMKMLEEEKLNTFKDTYDVYNKYSRKVSRDCYVSYKGNRYSVPWKYAGRIAILTEDGNDNLKITVDNEIVAEHIILTGTGRISRKKEHFEGLLKNIRDENIMKFSQDVEKRDLRKYEVI